MMRDSKFGYHWIWIIPVVAVLGSVRKIGDYYKKIRLKLILKQNPKIKELSILSGIQKDKNK